jgi:multiple sugar transport system substrate-binding protein
MSKIALAALAAVALTPFAAHAQKMNLTFLTHWSPDSVAMLEKAANAYAKEHADVAVSIRAVPFGDLLTTLRASAGGSGGATMASIYNAWLPDLARDKLLAQIPDAMGTEVKADWPAGVVGASSTGGALYGFPNESTSTPSTTIRSSSKPTGSLRRPPIGMSSSPTPGSLRTRPRVNGASA